MFTMSVAWGAWIAHLSGARGLTVPVHVCKQHRGNLKSLLSFDTWVKYIINIIISNYDTVLQVSYPVWAVFYTDEGANSVADD